MTWPGLAALSAAALALTVPAPGLAAVRGKTVSSALAAPGPAYAPGSRLCATGTHNFRIFWDETHGSPNVPAGRRAVDQRCATVPSLVRRIAVLVEGVRSREMALGFKPPASDAGRPRNGGDGRYDIYLVRQPAGVLGQTGCTYLKVGGRPGRRWSSTMIMSRLPLAVDPDRLLRETIAHEYFHAVQCRIAARLDLLPSSIVEGTANWMAAAVTDDWARSEGPFLGNLPGRLLRSAASTRSVTRQGYDAWGFWFQATQGTARPALIRKLFRRSAHRTRRTSGDADVRAVVPALEQTLVFYAMALRGARPIGATLLPPAYRNNLRDPSPLLDLGRRRTASATMRVAPIGYRFPAVAWEDEAGSVTIKVVGPRGSSVELVGAIGARTQVGGVTFFQIDGTLAGEATVVIVNAGRAIRSVTVSASR